jgi:8-amino-7-oxononanoate synthase
MDMLEKIEKIKSENNYRDLKFAHGLDFASNDYLGLANHPKIKAAVINYLNSGGAVGSGGARLLTGNKKEHQELEEFAADYFNKEACLFFSSGFMANYAIFTTLPQRKDFIIYDELIHASVRDGIQASLAKSIKFSHNDLSSLKEKIKKAQSLNAEGIWIAIESVYSMDGDIADISGILELIKTQKNIYLIIDEAHAVGIFGQDGKGPSYNVTYENLIVLHTCGKALGVSGALVCASSEIIEYLINKSRPFIFTTAESPIIAVAVKEALIISQEENWRREKLLELIEYTNNNLQSRVGSLTHRQEASNALNTHQHTQIIPIILENSQKALDAAAFLQSKGFDIRAVRPPTVPSARLRISLNSNREKNEIDELFSHIMQYTTPERHAEFISASHSRSQMRPIMRS